MAVTTLTPDRYTIGLNNYTAVPYNKNGSPLIGGYNRVSYVWEVFINPDYSSISGSTVSAVSINVTYSANTTTSNHTLTVRPQDKGTWTDNGTNPYWSTFATTPWNAELSSVASISGTGTKVIPTSANLVSHVQSYVSGTYPDSTYKGLILTQYTEFFGWYATISNVTMDITYTSGSTRRRINIT